MTGIPVKEQGTIYEEESTYLYGGGRMSSNVLVYNRLIYKLDVIEEVFIAETFIERFMGYRFREEPHYKAIMFNSCNSVNTFFMKFSIDVIFINQDLEIIKKVEDLKPGKVIFPVKEATIVIKGKQGMFKNLKVGDKVVI